MFRKYVACISYEHIHYLLSLSCEWPTRVKAKKKWFLYFKIHKNRLSSVDLPSTTRPPTWTSLANILWIFKTRSHCCPLANYVYDYCINPTCRIADRAHVHKGQDLPNNTKREIIKLIKVGFKQLHLVNICGQEFLRVLYYTTTARILLT